MDSGRLIPVTGKQFQMQGSAKGGLVLFAKHSLLHIMVLSPIRAP